VLSSQPESLPPRGEKKGSPFRKGGKGDLNFLLFRHCEKRSDVAISSFIIFMKNKKPKKMRSSRLLNTKPQDDASASDGDPHALKKRGLRMTD